MAKTLESGKLPNTLAAGLAPASLIAVLVAVSGSGCGGQVSGAPANAADAPFHLEEHLEQASVEGFDLPGNLPESIAWDFGSEQPAWKATAGASFFSRAGTPFLSEPRLVPVQDALRLHLGEEGAGPEQDVHGIVYVDLPDLRRGDWSHVLVRIRTSDAVRKLGISFNLYKQPERGGPLGGPLRYRGEDAVVIADGEIQTYRLRADWSAPWFGEWEGPWRQLGLRFLTTGPANLDLVSVTIVPKAQLFADAPIGVRTVGRGDTQSRAVFAHAPGKLRYRVRVPDDGHLDVGLGVLSEAVTFRVSAEGSDGASRLLLEETWSDPDRWARRTVDLSELAGRSVTLALEADAEQPGAVAFWAAPTLSGRRSTKRPNVILYVIDGAGADLMSVYGYNRQTTPNMERLAAEGAVFEYAHTNSGWTKPSTASFMTSLHHSVLGGFTTNSDQIPEQATTMAQHFHGAGYQTAVFTSNPFAGSLSGLQRGVDVFRDKGAGHNSASSAELQQDYWEWRESYTGEPYWVHFQTTDVHEPHEPPAPFGGLYVSPERREQFTEWWGQMHRTDGPDKDTVLGYYKSRLEIMGVEPKRFFDIQRGLYDETMAHNDHQLGRLVEQLKARGEWEHTLLIIASDHGHPAGSFSRFGRGLVDPPPDDWEGALADSYRTRIPLIFVWPGKIPPGQRLTQRVSMIDLLPTVLQLVGLPQPDVLQGQSLAPLLLGRNGWEPRPLIFDQFQAHLESGELLGHVEIIDGRWAASLEIVPDWVREEYASGDRQLTTAGGWRAPRPHRTELPPLLLYDLRNDPLCLRNVNDDHPELVEKYTGLLQDQWEAHRTLAQRFTSDGAAALTPEQLETLRALGYIE